MGKHAWAGWSQISNNRKTGAYWCLVCKVGWGEPVDEQPWERL